MNQLRHIGNELGYFSFSAFFGLIVSLALLVFDLCQFIHFGQFAYLFVDFIHLINPFNFEN